MIDAIDAASAADDQRLARFLISQREVAQQRIWLSDLAREEQNNDSADSDPMSAPVSDRVQELASQLDGITSEQRRQAKIPAAALDRWRAAMRDEATTARGLAPAFTKPVLEALDEAAMDRVVDGSVWRSADFDAFYRLLDRATHESVTESSNKASSPAVRVGVVPLLQQPAVFRGQRVRISGTVARAQRITARENNFGIVDYWQLWIRPGNGVDRPLVAIVPRVSDAIAAVDSDATLEAGPTAELVGTFIKRLAYQSSAGADLAPVIIGRLENASSGQSSRSGVADLAPGDTEPAGTKTPGSADRPSDNELRWRLAGTVAVACLLGVGLAAFITWRTTVATRHSRQLRRIGRPSSNEFLSELKRSATAFESDERR